MGIEDAIDALRAVDRASDLPVSLESALWQLREVDLQLRRQLDHLSTADVNRNRRQLRIAGAAVRIDRRDRRSQRVAALRQAHGHKPGVRGGRRSARRSVRVGKIEGLIDRGPLEVRALEATTSTRVRRVEDPRE